METFMELEDSCDSGYAPSDSGKCCTPVSTKESNNNNKKDGKNEKENHVVNISPWTPLYPKRIKIKYMVVGDERIGKSTLVRNYACPAAQKVISRTNNNLYMPTTQESYCIRKKIFVGDESMENPFAKVTVTICDTGGNVCTE